jgi:predicted Ser/Thr protein kinase
MVRCSACAHESTAGSRFCAHCAAPLDATAAETAVMAAAGGSNVVPSQPVSRQPQTQPSLASSTAVDEGRFLPGVVVAGRYRIAGLLGRGGMGEVYRATDLALSQAVALKFLPETASRDDRAIARFYNEVRIARQVTHPNVCRVYDIGEIDGQHYISMEFVDGENLACLLRRIGRLPGDKAVEMARKICAGLAAAHEKGVLHRDLKPANVMIDALGNPVLMDFGLAGLSEQLQNDVRSGTPAYMSPEQLAGTEVTVKSDIYALGLVLYELFTGKRAFEAASLMELMQMQERAEPASISSVARDLDPAVERIVMRCLDPSPSGRPAHARAVAAGLGGDALAAALAAGETPSPELIAAAGESEGLRPKLAIAWLAAALVSIAVTGYLGAGLSLTSKIPLEATPDALAREARTMLKGFGYAAKPVDTAYGFQYFDRYIDYLKRHPAEAAARWRSPAAGMPPMIQFWYRESPGFLVPQRSFSVAASENDPPLEISGMTSLRTDPDGKLLQFEAITPQREAPPAAPAAPFDWAALFRAAALDMTRFQTIDPIWTPLASWDTRAAWTGVDAATGAKLRVEAAAWRGRPVFFRILGPWSTPERMEAGERTPQVLTILAIYVLLIAACSLAWRNFRSGRGDRRGALKLFLLYFGCMLAARVIAAHHAPVFAEADLVWKSLTVSALNAAAIWVFYIALEPSVRRRWPETMISWSRFTTKGIRDPRVGRDILYGAAMGGIFAILKLVQIRLHGVAAPPSLPDLSGLGGLRGLAAFGLQAIDGAMFDPMIVLFVLFLMRVLLRKEWIAAAAAVAFLSAIFSGSPSAPWIDIPATVLLEAMEVFLLLRFGVPAVIVAGVVGTYLLDVPITVDFSSWYAGIGVLALVACALIAWYGFRTALAGRSVWGDEVG